MPFRAHTLSFWQCPNCHSGLSMVRPLPLGTQHLFCPTCQTRLVPTQQTDSAQNCPDTPIIRKREYRCTKCGARYRSSEWLDVFTDRIVFHLAELSRFFAHPYITANLGEEAFDADAKTRSHIVLRRHQEDGTIREYRKPMAELLWELFRDRKSMELEMGPLLQNLGRLIVEFDLPLRIVHDKDRYMAVPAGGWVGGQIYGDENDPRYSRITFGLDRPGRPTVRRSGHPND